MREGGGTLGAHSPGLVTFCVCLLVLVHLVACGGLLLSRGGGLLSRGGVIIIHWSVETQHSFQLIQREKHAVWSCLARASGVDTHCLYNMRTSSSFTTIMLLHSCFPLNCHLHHGWGIVCVCLREVLVVVLITCGGLSVMVVGICWHGGGCEYAIHGLGGGASRGSFLSMVGA